MQIDLCVQFDTSLAAAKACPGEQLQAQVDGRRIESIHGPLQGHAELVVGIQAAGFGNEHLGEIAKDAPIAMFVGVGQGAAADRAAKAGMVQFGPQGPQTGFDIAQAVAARELGEGQAQELIEAGELPNPTVALITANALIELVPRKVIEQLSENRSSLMHGPPLVPGNREEWLSSIHEG